jgi:tetratricopeptide (TPR) repeat protein
LKVLPFASTMDAKQLQRFKNEARAAASLHHEHIVPVYGVGCERGVHYYAMQLIDGKSLAVLIRQLRGEPADCGGGGAQCHKGDSFHSFQMAQVSIESKVPIVPGDLTASYPGTAAPTTEAVAGLVTQVSRKDRAHYRSIAEMIAQAANALEHAHTLGVVHRDVKPGNLILDNAGHLWVTDFGLARFGSDADLTMTGDLLGTLRYMSPEQALAKHGLVDHRTDIYSLGATLYELLTLRPAMRGADKQEILKKIAFEEPRPPRSIDRAIPAELETIALKALAKEPAERYSTAGELTSDLRRWLGDLTIKARPPGLRQRVVKWARRHPGVTATAGISAALVLGLVIAGLGVNNALMKEEKKRTQTVLELAFESANEMLVKIADEMGEAPGLEQTQRSVVQSAVAIYERLADYQGAVPGVERDRGLAQFRLGMMHDRLGYLKKGGDAYIQAADMFRRLAQQEPNKAEYRYWQARSLSERGDLCDRLGKGEDAEKLARQAHGLFERAASDFPNDLLIRAGLADCCLVLGTVNYVPGPQYVNFDLLPDSSPRRWEESVNLLRQAVKLYPTVIVNDPERSDYRWRFHRVQSVLSKMRTLSVDERERLANDSVAGFEALSDAHPRKPRPRAELCEALVRRGWVLMRGAPGPAAGEANFRGALRIANKLVEEYPDVPYYGTLQAGALCALGFVLLITDRPDQAEPLLKQAASAVDKTPDGHVPPWYFTCLAARSHEFLGYTFDQAGRLDEAKEAFRQALRLDMRAASEFPNSGTWVCVHNNTHRLASVLSRKGSVEDAIAVYRANAEFWEGQAAQHPSNPVVRRCHAWSLNGVAYVLQMHRRWDQADQAYDEALDAHDKLEKSGLLNPGSGVYWRAVDSDGWKQQQMRRAWLYAKAGRPGDAEKAYREIVKRAYRDLNAASPGTLAQRMEVYFAMTGLGVFLNKIGQHDESIAAYEDEIRQLDRWTDDFPNESDAGWGAYRRMELAFVYQSVGKATKANRVAEEAIAILRKLAASAKPMSPRYLAEKLVDQGLIRWRTGRVEDAASAVREAVEIMEKLVADPAHTGAARSSFEDVLAGATSRHAHLLEHTGQFAKAEAAYEKAVELRRRLAEAVIPGDWSDDGSVLRPGTNEYLRTRTNWRRSLDALALFHVRRGQTEQAADHCAKARTVLEQMVTAYPSDAHALNQLAVFLVTCPVETLRDPPRAVRFARKAAVLLENSTFVGTLGCAQFRAGDFQSAVANLDRATGLQEWQFPADDQFFRAMAHWQVGNIEVARRAYDDAVRGLQWPYYGNDAYLHMLREEAAALLGVK